jgi:hypothetical protein
VKLGSSQGASPQTRRGVPGPVRGNVNGPCARLGEPDARLQRRGAGGGRCCQIPCRRLACDGREPSTAATAPRGRRSGRIVRERLARRVGAARRASEHEAHRARGAPGRRASRIRTRRARRRSRAAVARGRLRGGQRRKPNAERLDLQRRGDLEPLRGSHGCSRGRDAPSASRGAETSPSQSVNVSTRSGGRRRGGAHLGVR